MAISTQTLNPFTNFNIGGIGTIGNILLIIAIATMILVIFGSLIIYFTMKKSFTLNIHVFKLIGNVPTRVAIFKAKEVPFGMAGDKLWKVAPHGIAMLFKVIKWLPAGRFQTAANEYWYWIRDDGEWINFTPTNIDKKSREMKIEFVQEDMRLQRLATEKLLAQRLLNKGFWEKYGLVLGYVFFFLIITIAMVIIFYQWSQIVDKIATLVSLLDTAIRTANAQPIGLVPT